MFLTLGTFNRNISRNMMRNILKLIMFPFMETFAETYLGTVGGTIYVNQWNTIIGRSFKSGTVRLPSIIHIVL